MGKDKQQDAEAARPKTIKPCPHCGSASFAHPVNAKYCALYQEEIDRKMSLECSECESDVRGGHDPSCSRYKPEVEQQDAGAAPECECHPGVIQPCVFCERDQLKEQLSFAEDAANKGDRARQEAGGMELRIQELEQERDQLRAAIEVAKEIIEANNCVVPRPPKVASWLAKLEEVSK